MPVTSSKVKEIYDAHASVLLRGTGAAAITADTTTTGISLNELRAAYWQNYEIPYGMLEIAVNVTNANAGSVGTIISLLVDDVSAMSDSPVQVAALVLPASGNGFYRLMVDCDSIPGLDADHTGTDKFLALKVDVPATGSPSLQVAAWLCGSDAT